MGKYDSISVPISGTPISSSNFGIKVRDAILDLDYRLSTVDTSTGTGKAYSASGFVVATTTELVALTVTNMTFVAGIAYEATIRTGLQSATAGTLCSLRLRKTNTAGVDFGEYFRFEGKGAAGGQVMGALAQIFLINNTSADVVTDVALCASASVAAANAITLFATSASPRFLVIKPAGFASDYAGMGVQVT